MPLTLNYLSFVTADLPRTLAFYRALGLPIPDGAHLNTAGKLEDHVEVAQGGLIRIPSISITSRRTLDVPPILGTRTESYSFHSERFRKSYGIFQSFSS